MSRNHNGLKRANANRTDLLTPKPGVTGPGQPNGQFNPNQVPKGLPYGERGELTNALKQTPKPPRPPGPAMATAPTSTDMTQGDGFNSAMAAFQSRQRQPVTPMMAPTERPDEPVTAGSIGQPDAVLGQPGPGAIAPLLQQIAMLTGSAGLADLATRTHASGS